MPEWPRQRNLLTIPSTPAHHSTSQSIRFARQGLNTLLLLPASSEYDTTWSPLGRVETRSGGPQELIRSLSGAPFQVGYVRSDLPAHPAKVITTRTSAAVIKLRIVSPAFLMVATLGRGTLFCQGRHKIAWGGIFGACGGAFSIATAELRLTPTNPGEPRRIGNDTDRENCPIPGKRHCRANTFPC